MVSVTQTKLKNFAKISGMAGIPLVFILIYYLLTLNAITILDYSGDMSCAGTIENPCLAIIKFKTNQAITIRPINSTWLFETDKVVREIKVYRDGKIMNFSKSNSFSKNKTYVLTFMGYKNNPGDRIKWSFGEIDPYWNPPASSGGVNLTQTENLIFTGNENITRILSIYRYVNVTEFSMNLSGNISKYDLSLNITSASQDNIIAWWKMENQIEEINSAYYNLTAFNSTAGSPLFVVGKIDFGTQFNETNGAGWKITKYSDDLNFNESGVNFTISFWINIATFETQMIIDHYDGSAGWVILQEEEKIRITGFNGTTSNIYTTNNISLNTWQYVTIIKNSSDVCIFVNATKENCVARGDDIIGVIGNNLTFGVYYAGSGNYPLDGILDEIMMWKRALSVDEIQEIYLGACLNNLNLKIGDTTVWNYTRPFYQINNKTNDLSSALNLALNNGNCNCTKCSLNGNYCNINFTFHSNILGNLTYYSNPMGYTIPNVTITNTTAVRFYANATVVNATQPTGQNSTRGLFNVTNKNSFNVTIWAKINETRTYARLKLNKVYNWTTSIILNTTNQIIYNCMGNNSQSYLWAWADFFASSSSCYQENATAATCGNQNQSISPNGTYYYDSNWKNISFMIDGNWSTYSGFFNNNAWGSEESYSNTSTKHVSYGYFNQTNMSVATWLWMPELTNSEITAFINKSTRFVRGYEFNVDFNYTKEFNLTIEDNVSAIEINSTIWFADSFSNLPTFNYYYLYNNSNSQWELVSNENSSFFSVSTFYCRTIVNRLNVSGNYRNNSLVRLRYISHGNDMAGQKAIINASTKTCIGIAVPQTNNNQLEFLEYKIKYIYGPSSPTNNSFYAKYQKPNYAINVSWSVKANATEWENKNISIPKSCFRNPLYLKFISFLDIPILCYQEYDNVSTACGGLNTGKYWTDGNFDDDWYLYNGNWSDYAMYGDSVNATFYINKSKPNFAMDAIWAIADVNTSGDCERRNLTLDSSCFNQNPLQFKVISSPNDDHVYWYCWNGNVWVNKRTSSAPSNPYVCEESVIWNISDSWKNYYYCKNNTAWQFLINDSVNGGFFEEGVYWTMENRENTTWKPQIEITAGEC